MPVPTKLIDSHQHVRWHQRDEHGLVADMDAHGISYAWLLSWQLSNIDQAPEYNFCYNPVHFQPDGSHPGIPLSDLLDTRKQYPDRFIVGFCPHPLWPQAPAILEAAYNMHGIRVCGEWKFRVAFDDPRSIAIFQKAGQLKLPVVLHLDVPLDELDGVAIDEIGDVAFLARFLAPMPVACQGTQCLVGGLVWRNCPAAVALWCRLDGFYVDLIGT